MAKIAKISFDFLVLYSGDISGLILRDIIASLPSDTKIIGIGSDYGSVNGWIKVQSNSYNDISPGNIIPEIICNFKKSPLTGNTYLDNIDQSAALTSYAPTCSCSPGMVCGVCVSIALNQPPPTPHPQHIFKTTSVQTTSVPAGWSLAGTSTGGFSGGCNHNWKTYQGLGVYPSFEYCEKCNEKKI